MTCREFIDSLASRKIQCFKGTIDADGEYLDDVYPSNRSLAESIASDYRDRFLIELIQNAYDAHPDGTRDGRIQITFDKHLGKFGTLFVANGGCAFDKDNVKSLCDIGLSKKPLDVSIGNKGLGFRSVIQITDTPKIYSQCSDAKYANEFSGFCFRFAVDEDYKRLLGDKKHQELARRDLPMFHIPQNIERQSDVVRNFAKNGFSTVVELPLKDEESRKAVQDEIESLQNQKVPMLIFLNRVESLSVRIFSEAEQIDAEFELTRKKESIESSSIELSRVCLGEAEQYLLARQPVSENALKEAIDKGISSGELNEYWKRWSGDGEVSIAVRLDSIIDSGRIYTFLPMGEQAVAPFRGYLHGSFSPDSSRKSLNGLIRLNALLISKAAELAAKTIHYIISHTDSKEAKQLTEDECATAVVDLLCWSNVDNLKTDGTITESLIHELTKRFDGDCFSTIPIVPCVKRGATAGQKITWQHPVHARRWPNNCDMFAVAVAADFATKTNVWPIWDHLENRIDKLNDFLSKNATGFAIEPSGRERGRLVLEVAEKLSAGHRTSKSKRAKWEKFYREIPNFMAGHGDSLAGLPVLLGDDNQIHKAMSKEFSADDDIQQKRRRKRKVAAAAIFSPPDPSRTSTDNDFQFKPPKKLSAQFAFLNSKLPWHKELGNTRKFLEEHELVGEFDRETVLLHLSRTLANENRREVLKGGLRWAFQLWRQPRPSRPVKMQKQHRFKVPTLSGQYLEAAEVFFSKDWPERTEGKALQEFLDLAPPEIDDLKRIKKRRLASPDDPAFLGKFIDDWVIFLKELGVKEGLNPESKKAKQQLFQLSIIRNFEFLEDFEIPSKFKQLWSEDISKHNHVNWHQLYSTKYRIQGELAWLPGQAEFDRFSSKCKEAYAKLILHWLSHNTDLRLDFSLVHHYYNEEFAWPTPAKSFLRSARWLPVDDPTSPPNEPCEQRPCEIWVDTKNNKRFQTFLRRPTSTLRDPFNRRPDQLIQNLKTHFDIRIFNNPEVLSKQIEFLSQQYASRGFDKHFEPHLLNLYDETWQNFIKHLESVGYQQTSRPSKFLIQRGEKHEQWSMPDQDSCESESDGEYLYVCDSGRESDPSLIEASGRPFFCLRDPIGNGQKVGKLFRELYSQHVKCLSQISWKLLADESNIESCESVAILDICPQLRAMVATAMEALTGTDAQRLPADREKILTKLDSLELVKAEKLRFIIDDISVPVNQDECKAFHLRFEKERSIVAVQVSLQAPEEWTWNLIDASMPAICEALGARALCPHLRLLVSNLKGGNAPQQIESNPADDVEKFSKILHLSQSKKNAANDSLAVVTERSAQWIKVVLHYLLGDEAVRTFDEEDNNVFNDIDLLRNALSPLLENTPFSADKVIDECRRAEKARDVRRNMGFEFRKFNDALQHLRLETEVYAEDHKLQIENYARENEGRIIDCLRTHFADQLENMIPVDQYSDKVREFKNLEPDPGWLNIFETPPENVLSEHVDAWLKRQGAPTLESNLEDLEPLHTVQENNRQVIDKFVKEALPIIRKWCEINQSDRSSLALMEIEQGKREIRSRLENAGVFDYKSLEEIKLIKWLEVLDLWPDRMSPSLNLDDLGLSQDDMDAEKREAMERKEEKKREERCVPFNGERIDPADVDLFELSMQLRDNMPQHVIKKSLGANANLDIRKQNPAGGSNRGRGEPGARSSVPPEKTELIGRLGECLVYHWLNKKLPSQNIDEAWCSENGSIFTGRDGNDALGYDFEVRYRKQKWQIEVKASLSDPCWFTLGETQVKAATVAARPRNGIEFKIAYVSNLQDNRNMNIELLPNPMTKEGGLQLQLLGTGIRYRFDRG